MTNKEQSRRTWLITVGTAGALAISGCIGEDGEETEENGTEQEGFADENTPENAVRHLFDPSLMMISMHTMM